MSLELSTPYNIPDEFFDRFHIYAADLAKFMAGKSQSITVG